MRTGLFAGILLFGWLFNWNGEPAWGATYQSADRLTLTGSYTDNLFAWGGQIDAEFRSSDDVFLAGGQLDLRVQISENLFVAGGDISISQSTSRELVLAGGSLRLDRTRIQDDLIVAGGDIRVRPGTRIEGSATIAGGEIFYGGQTRGDVVIYGGKITLAGQFSGNVQVTGDELEVLPETIIRGNLLHSVSDVEIAPGARIVGKTVALTFRDRDFWFGPMTVFLVVLFSIGGLLVVPMIAWMFPDIVDRGRDEIRARFWETLGKGTAVTILTPLLILLLLASVFATPFALTLLPFAAVATLLAWSTTVFTVSDQLRRWLIRPAKRGKSPVTPTRRSRFAWTFLGAFVLSVLLGIPVLGFLLCLIAFFAGVGAIYSQAIKHLG